ncbi:MAG: hypothetical protein IJM66_10730 [Muribaculaceae bacterium]|nr:hypothetical protein [Muribaculaceae bacterium]
MKRVNAIEAIHCQVPQLEIPFIHGTAIAANNPMPNTTGHRTNDFASFFVILSMGIRTPISIMDLNHAPIEDSISKARMSVEIFGYSTT